jgi:hypothetical protein
MAPVTSELHGFGDLAMSECMAPVWLSDGAMMGNSPTWLHAGIPHAEIVRLEITLLSVVREITRF